MKISENFVVQEFLPKDIFSKQGLDPRWFVSIKQVALAEFYKRFFSTYYQNKYKNPGIKASIVINDWHTGGTKQFRGFRPPDCKEGSPLSQHRFCNAFDCDIVAVFPNGKRIEADYSEIQKVILANEAEFMKNGLTTIEDVSFAPTWLHSDFRFTGLDKILVVRP